MSSAGALKDSLLAPSSNSSINQDGSEDNEHVIAGASVSFNESGRSQGSRLQNFCDSLVSLLHVFLPHTYSPLDVAAVLVKNCAHHRTTKQYYALNDKRRFRAFRMVNSQAFRKTAIACAMILALLPAIEVPVSVAAPCWLSFVLELICYTVLTLRVSLEHMCHKVTLSRNPWFCLLNASLLVCWIDVIVTMSLVSSSGGDWLSFNNCGMPEPSRDPRAESWVYVIARASRYARPVIFLEWNIRTRYLLRSMLHIISDLLNILSILGVFIFLFASLGFFVWSNPAIYISALPDHFAYFRSFIQSLITSATFTTTENYPDCMLDYMGVSFANFFIFLAFAVLSIFFALNVVLSTVYNTYENNLREYYQQRRLKDANGLARAFQYLCDANNTVSRQRFQTFMRVYDGVNHLDHSRASSLRRLKASATRADIMFYMLTARLRIIQRDTHPDVQSYRENKISEVALMQKLVHAMEAPLSFFEFVHLVPLTRYKFYIREGNATSFDKQQILLQQQTSFADVMKHMIDTDCLRSTAVTSQRAACDVPPLSAHSTSYFVSRVNPAFNAQSGVLDVDHMLSSSDVPHMSLLETSDAASPPAVPRPSLAASGISLLGSTGINMSLTRLVQSSKHQRAVAFVNHAAWRKLCNVMTIAQFGMCVLQLEIVYSEQQCLLTRAGAQEDDWSGCQSWSYIPSVTLDQIDHGFNVAHMVVSSILLFDIVAAIRMKGQLFFLRGVGSIAWMNSIDALLQCVIFIYDVLQLTALPSTVTGADFIAMCVLRLLRVYGVLSLARTVTSTMSLALNLFPILKAFFLIAYTFFFIFSIFGMSLFSYAASNRGIAFYPTKDQYAQFYIPRDAAEYACSSFLHYVFVTV